MAQPVPGLIEWKFMQKVLHSPSQRMSVVANRVMSELLTAENQFQTIYDQVDGLDFNPISSDLNFAESPFLTFQVKNVGYRKRGHIWGHAVPIEDWHRTSDSYQSQLPGLAAASFARWKDRVMLYFADDYRPLRDQTDGVTVTQSELPAGNKYAIKNTVGGNNKAAFGRLDLDALKHSNLFFKNNEIGTPGGFAAGGMPVCYASPGQIQNLLNVTEVVDADFNTVKALARGEVNTFMGHEFVHTKAGGKTRAAALADDAEIRKTVGFIQGGTDRSVTNASTGANTTQLPADLEKIVIAHPTKAFAMGILPRSGYMNVWQNPNRHGTWEYLLKESIGYKRCLDEYVLVMYASDSADGGVGIRKAPTQNSVYYSNFDATGGSWTYSQTAA